jgi:hypothetical protein
VPDPDDGLAEPRAAVGGRRRATRPRRPRRPRAGESPPGPRGERTSRASRCNESERAVGGGDIGGLARIGRVGWFGLLLAARGRAGSTAHRVPALGMGTSPPDIGPSPRQSARRRSSSRIRNKLHQPPVRHARSHPIGVHFGAERLARPPGCGDATALESPTMPRPPGDRARQVSFEPWRGVGWSWDLSGRRTRSAGRAPCGCAVASTAARSTLAPPTRRPRRRAPTGTLGGGVRGVAATSGSCSAASGIR